MNVVDGLFERSQTRSLQQSPRADSGDLFVLLPPFLVRHCSNLSLDEVLGSTKYLLHNVLRAITSNHSIVRLHSGVDLKDLRRGTKSK